MCWPIRFSNAASCESFFQYDRQSLRNTIFDKPPSPRHVQQRYSVSHSRRDRPVEFGAINFCPEVRNRKCCSVTIWQRLHYRRTASTKRQELSDLFRVFQEEKWWLWCARPGNKFRIILNTWRVKLHFFQDIFLTLIIFRASGESMRTQWSTSNIPVPSLEACDPNLLKSQFNRLLFANWAQFVWFPLIIAAKSW